jgi:hypothetical protein
MIEILSTELRNALEELTPNVGSFTIEPDFWDFWEHTDPDCWYHLIGRTVEELTPLLASMGGSVGEQREIASDGESFYLGIELNESGVTVTLAPAEGTFEEFQKKCGGGRKGFDI